MDILEKHTKENARSYAVRVLMHNIISLELPPGSSVSENELSTILNLFFKVKNFTPTINIKYNKNFFKFESTSIIFINIAKIIYMVIVIFYHLIKVRKTSSFDKVNLKEEF